MKHHKYGRGQFIAYIFELLVGSEDVFTNQHCVLSHRRDEYVSLTLCNVGDGVWLIVQIAVPMQLVRNVSCETLAILETDSMIS